MQDIDTYRQIQWLKKCGDNKSRVAEYLGLSRGTVMKFWDMSLEEFKKSYYERNRMEALLLHKKEIIKWLQKDCMLSASKIRKRLKNEFGEEFSERTVARYLLRLRNHSRYINEWKLRAALVQGDSR